MSGRCRTFAAHAQLSTIRHIAGAKNPFVLIFWFVSFAILASVTSYQVLGLVLLLNSNNALTLVSFKTYPTKPFPAVTICSLNPYRKSALQDISDFTTLLNLLDNIQKKQTRTKRNIEQRLTEEKSNVQHHRQRRLLSDDCSKITSSVVYKGSCYFVKYGQKTWNDAVTSCSAQVNLFDAAMVKTVQLATFTEALDVKDFFTTNNQLIDTSQTSWINSAWVGLKALCNQTSNVPFGCLYWTNEAGQPVKQVTNATYDGLGTGISFTASQATNEICVYYKDNNFLCATCDGINNNVFAYICRTVDILNGVQPLLTTATMSTLKTSSQSIHDYLCWGVRFGNHFASFIAQNAEECIQLCKQNRSCDAVTFQSDLTICFYYNSSNMANGTDPTMNYGSWMKTQIIADCSQQRFSSAGPMIDVLKGVQPLLTTATMSTLKTSSQSIRDYLCWGVRFTNDFGSFTAQNDEECIQLCKQNRSCDAVTFKRSTNRCFYYNSSNMDTQTDPTMNYGSWMKTQIIADCSQQRFSSAEPTSTSRVFIKTTNNNARNSISPSSSNVFTSTTSFTSEVTLSTKEKNIITSQNNGPVTSSKNEMSIQEDTSTKLKPRLTSQLPPQTIDISLITSMAANADIAKLINILGLENNTDQVSQVTTMKEAIIYLVGNLPDKIRLELGYDFNSVMLHCTFDGIKCTEADFVKWNEPSIGNCFTFNHINGIHHSTEFAGSAHGLNLIFNASQTDYVTTTDTAGLTGFITYNKATLFADMPSFYLPPNYILDIALDYQQVERMQKSSGGCVSETEANNYFYDGEYSAQGCSNTCYQKQVISECGCGDPSYPLPATLPQLYEYCDVNKKSCVDGIADLQDGDFNCTCNQQCSERIFTPTTTLTKMRNFLKLNASDSVAAINVFHKQMLYFMLQESPAYTILNFFSDLCNVVSFNLEIAFHSMFEIISLVYLFFSLLL